VDNPHTKPLPFWERLLTDVAAESPEVVFLAEAFTLPPMMQTLAMIGFHQSYTYFAWRNSKTELEDYVQELASDQGSFLRPSIWPTTHDILTPYMQQGGRAAFKIRAILAATFAPTWGIYSGYELIEDIARPGSEEQIDNEKYEFKARDYAEPGAMEMEGLLTRLNAARREHLALRRLRNVAVHPTTDPAMVAFSRHVPAEVAPDGQADTVLVVVNIDPHNTREGLVELDLAAIGLGDAAGDIRFHAHDLLSGQTYDWGREPFVRLDPATNPGHLIHLVPAGGRP
jgi:starch synthase (maltosyl-transferring)